MTKFGKVVDVAFGGSKKLRSKIRKVRTTADNTVAEPGRLGDMLYNTNDTSVYKCTVASVTAGTWVKINA